jgi:hypothetical protein
MSIEADMANREADMASDDLRDASVKALALLERNAVTIDGEWGDCRSLEELERDNALPIEILALRRAIDNYNNAVRHLIAEILED